MTATPATRDGASSGHEAVAAVEAAWNAGGQPWNPPALADIYTSDALFHGGRPSHYVGQVAIRDYFESYRGVIEVATLVMRDQHIRQLAPGIVLAQGFGDFSFVLAGQQATTSLLRTTMVLVWQDRWRIQAHHFSPPPPVPPLGNT